MKKGNPRPLTPQEEAELATLATLPEAAIDTLDAPEIRDWSGARRGLFYRPIKQQLTLRLDADLIAWFRKHATKGEGYQTRINRVLREYVQHQSRQAG
jgi:uncharacterized protein (DUF4415 family)